MAVFHSVNHWRCSLPRSFTSIWQGLCAREGKGGGPAFGVAVLLIKYDYYSERLLLQEAEHFQYVVAEGLLHLAFPGQAVRTCTAVWTSPQCSQGSSPVPA